MDITTIPGALLDNHPRRNNRGILLDITIVDPSNSSSLENAARNTGNYLTEAVEQKKNKYSGSFPASHSLISFVMSPCGVVDSDVYVLMKELTDRAQVGDTLRRFQAYGEGDGSSTSSAAILYCFTVGTLMMHASSSLQTGSGAYGHPTALFAGPKSVQVHYTEEVTESARRQGANGVGVKNGNGNGDKGGGGRTNARRGRKWGRGGNRNGNRRRDQRTNTK